MKLSKKLGLAASLAGALILAACGDDGSSGKPAPEKDGTASVPTYDDLAHCTKSHYGEIVFVEDESAYFECTSEDWAEVDESKLDSLLAAASSSSEADKDKPKSSSSLKADSTETADVEKVEVDSITVKGFAQKGPFASGTAVTVYGLDSLLEKTKTKFTGKVSGDSGAYSVSKIVLPSQYALVEVSGYYQNEVTGKKTSGSKTTLSALVDLSEGKTVKANVNLFTDLEYARAKHLVLKEKFNVPAAKKRATKELLAIFGGKGDDDLTATALSLSDTTSAGKALLFASILLQGELSASKFGILLGGIEEFFGSTGGLDSAEATAAFADWASKVDSTDNFAAIRENIKKMNLAAIVPDFESALYAFWTNEYGLGACTDSLESTIEKNSNKKSENYGAGYACTAKRWHKATALDTELGLCTGKMEGQFKEYKGGKTAEYYVCKAGSWNKITETQFELKECTEDRDNEYVMTKDSSYFVCSDKQWIELDAVTYELKLCTEDRNMELGKTGKSGSYVCEWDGKNGNWRKASDADVELGVCGTESVTAGKIYKTKGGDYYLCASGEWKKSDQLSYELQDAGECSAEKNLTTFETENIGLYVCDNKEWRKATSLEADLGVCGATEYPKGSFKQKGGKYYVCKNEWKETDAVSFELEAECTQDSVFKKSDAGKYYVCMDGEWQTTNELTYTLGYCTTSNAGYMKAAMDKYWYCKDLNWEEIDRGTYSTGRFCNKDIDSTLVEGFACVHTGSGSSAVYSWREETAGEMANNAFCRPGLNDNVVHEGYVCELNGSVYAWRTATTAENITGKVCIYENKGVDGNYACDKSNGSYAWRNATTFEKAVGFLCESRKSGIYGNYACDYDGSKYQWRNTTAAEIATGSFCVENFNTRIVNGYVCQYGNTNWRTADPVELETGKVCGKLSRNDNGAVTETNNILYSGKYVCSAHTSTSSCLSNKINGYCWRNAMAMEKTLNTPCETRKNYERFGKYSGDMYRCVDTTAHTWSKHGYATMTDTRDNNTYRIVDVNDDTVMVDNLRYRHDNDSSSNWTCYQNKIANCNNYGVLYTWTAAAGQPQVYLDSYLDLSNVVNQGACPAGWHEPTSSEDDWVFKEMNEKGLLPEDVFGRYVGNKYEEAPCWWSATNNITDAACFMNADLTNTNGKYDKISKRSYAYLRCIKNRQ